MADNEQWFTEKCEEGGNAFGLRIKGKLHEEQSRYQKIEVYETTDWGNLMVLDGYTMVSSLDNFLYHEMMVHPALFIHPAPQRVAIIGGGDCGTLREVLKHPEVKQVTQIDIDERVTRVSEQFFPELCESNQDPRAELLFIDGIEWMQQAEAGSLDIIIVDSTDPIGPGEVLFSADFYRACQCALADGGLMIQQSESPLIHQLIIQRMYRNLHDSGFSDVKSLFFPQPIYPSGWWSATLGRKGAAIEGFREQDVAQRNFETRYYNSDIHRAAFAVPEFFRKILEPQS
ncbi:polyamine aminopropyltransferase [endosymbiont of Ridgeia piscesae]|jgi:spermidine synthase|uniref:Polyamine aminopropyltransferase n=1 Tax=endosymbiont of Ridgeia piscesae TaxID=54398 RepID=A0A0T5YTM3_9GAMM|nr:polyamine aminopropyltransferase [endosymbiont of Ridgeia piscesae]KRT53940.1 spermidine synthase [endosymbiont of Ridgeia piscesae]KRT57307.1 spermidine synthase [endosymbiont of Ridgeia piscesae]